MDDDFESSFPAIDAGNEVHISQIFGQLDVREYSIWLTSGIGGNLESSSWRYNHRLQPSLPQHDLRLGTSWRVRTSTVFPLPYFPHHLLFLHHPLPSSSLPFLFFSLEPLKSLTPIPFMYPANGEKNATPKSQSEPNIPPKRNPNANPKPAVTSTSSTLPATANSKNRSKRPGRKKRSFWLSG